MRHQRRKMMNVAPAHRKALLRNLSISLIEHGKIKSTVAKCKAVKPYVEKLITIAREDSVAARRLAYSKLNNREAVLKLFADVGPKHKERAGGYTRIHRLADTRVGDSAPMGIISIL